MDKLVDAIVQALAEIDWLTSHGLTITDLAEIAEDVATAVATVLPEILEALDG